jgi:hypothetical protein
MNANERSLAEEITEGLDALKKIRELEVYNAELKAYNTEMHGIEHDLEMKVHKLQAENDELKATMRGFFEDFLNVREESDSGRVFAPITISSCRVMMTEPLSALLDKMRTLSGAKKVSKE